MGSLGRVPGLGLEEKELNRKANPFGFLTGVQHDQPPVVSHPIAAVDCPHTVSPNQSSSYSWQVFGPSKESGDGDS